MQAHPSPTRYLLQPIHRMGLVWRQAQFPLQSQSSSGIPPQASKSYRSKNMGNYVQDKFHSIADIAWSPSGEQIATHAQTIPGDDCGTVVWDTTTGETLLTLAGQNIAIRSVGWSLDGATILTGHEDGAIILWDARTGTRTFDVEWTYRRSE